MSGLRIAFAIVGLTLLHPLLAHAQSAPSFGLTTVEVISEWRGQDRGDGSGSYSLVTTLTDRSSGISIRHERSSERNVDGDISSRDLTVVLEGGVERYRTETDPATLGPYAPIATSWAIPFDVEFHPDPRGNYRAQQKRVAEVVHSVVADARVSTKSGSDGRTSATVEIPGEHSADALAERFVGIRQSLRQADIGLAKLVVKGQATAPVGTAVATPGNETP